MTNPSYLLVERCGRYCKNEIMIHPNIFYGLSFKEDMPQGDIQRNYNVIVF